METKNRYNINDFERNVSFYGTLELLLTVKSFQLQEIRKRYLLTKNKKSKRTGSVERRESAIGGIVSLHLHKGKVIEEEILCELKEPRGIDVKNNQVAISSENVVYFIEDKIRSLVNPWFSYIHSLHFHPSKHDRVLVTSSGFDCMFEYNLSSLKQEWEWFAWENGFNKGIDPETGEYFYLVRNKEKAEQYQKEGKPYLLINNPSEQILPTSKRSAFINSAFYDDDHVLATMFHEGKVYRINMLSGESESILDGMINPHGGKRVGDKYFATNTRGGEVVIKNKEEEKIYQFSSLENKPEELIDQEWIQNSISIGSFIISIDSNRNSFIIFDPKEKKYDLIPYNDNWAIQDLVENTLKANVIDKIRSLQ